MRNLSLRNIFSINSATCLTVAVTFVIAGLFVVSGPVFANDNNSHHVIVPAPNPALSASCGLDIALVLDSSGSISTTELVQMKNAFKGFVNAFLPATPTLFSVTDFDFGASVLQTFTDNTAQLNIAINAPVSGGSTNWEDGLKKASSTFDPRSDSEHPDLVLFASDGNANKPGTKAQALQAAIVKANEIKNAGTRIITLGIGDNLNVNNLKAISSADAVYTSDFDTLASDLRDLAKELCGGTITVKKLIDTDTNLNTTNDQFPASGWIFDIDGTPSNPDPELTSVDGFTSSVEVKSGTYSVTETQKNGLKLLDAKCFVDNVMVGSSSLSGVEGIAVSTSDIVSCTFINHENEIPTITLNVPNPDNILVNDGPYIDPGYSASDLEDGNVTELVIVGGDVVDTTTVGTYLITYNVTDSDGAPAVQKTRAVNVSEPPSQCTDGVDNDGDGFIDHPEDHGCTNEEDNDENTPPVITADTIITLTLGDTFYPLNHATVNDDEDNPEPSLIVGGDTVDTNNVGDYIVTYDAIDSEGAVALQKILTVKVRAQCSDGVDNDDDSFTDSSDPGCHSDADSGNLESYDPDDNDETNPADVCANLEGIQLTIPNGLISINDNCVSPSPACSDAIDNDEDQLIDSADPGCHSDADSSNPESYDPNDNDETSTSEPVVVVVSLASNPNVIDQGQSSNLSWASTNATICTTDWTSATSTSGNQIVSPESTATYSMSCGNGTATSTATTTVTVNIPSPTPPSGGGGGGGSGSGSSSGVVLSASISPTSECFYLRDYMRRDLNNDLIEVLKLQAFLINFEGHSNVSLTGVFDQATFDAVSAFQIKYFNDILEPWGHTDSTGYVYILTLKKINEIYCQRILPLNQAQINEIAAFRELLESLRAQGINPELPSSSSETVEGTNTSTTSPPIIPIVGEAESLRGQNIRNLAAAIFASPETLLDMAKSLYGLLLILIALYILGSVLKDVLYKNISGNVRKRFLAKWLTVDTGLSAAIVVAYILEWWLILPLLTALIISLVWTSLYPEHNSIRASIKSWYLVSSAWLRSTSKVNEASKEPIKEPIKKETVEKVIIMGPKK